MRELKANKRSMFVGEKFKVLAGAQSRGNPRPSWSFDILLVNYSSFFHPRSPCPLETLMNRNAVVSEKFRVFLSSETLRILSG